MLYYSIKRFRKDKESSETFNGQDEWLTSYGASDTIIFFGAPCREGLPDENRCQAINYNRTSKDRKLWRFFGGRQLGVLFHDNS